MRHSWKASSWEFLGHFDLFNTRRSVYLPTMNAKARGLCTGSHCSAVGEYSGIRSHWFLGIAFRWQKRAFILERKKGNPQTKAVSNRTMRLLDWKPCQVKHGAKIKKHPSLDTAASSPVGSYSVTRELAGPADEVPMPSPTSSQPRSPRLSATGPADNIPPKPPSPQRGEATCHGPQPSSRSPRH